MAAFFIGWQTWEMMTFVLACAIVFVFAFGLARLWYTNRKIERVELIDEERRVRLAEMRHCGINARGGINDIPFGVRAIQSGIEVEGIWISRPNTPETSKRASAATLIPDGADPDVGGGKRKGKGKAAVDMGFEDPRRLHNYYHSSAGSSTDQTLASSPLARSKAPRFIARGSADELDPFAHASRPASIISAVTGADSYFDARPQQSVDALGYHHTWETSSQISQQYDGSSSSEGDARGSSRFHDAPDYARLPSQSYVH